MAEARPVEEATDAGLTEDYSCGYCLQRWDYMIDPRELPCAHVFCLPCLQDEWTNENEVQCGICLRTHDIEDLGGIPEAKLLNTSQEPADTESELCDVCKESPSKASSFCVDCGKKLCQQHLKVHDEYTMSFFGKEHKTISIGVFLVEPNSYKSVKCTMHKEYQIILACSECYTTFCHECETSSICEPRFGDESSRDRSPGSHTMHFLSKLAGQLRNSLTDQLKTLSDKVTGLCKEEKEAWRLLSDVEDKAKRMKETVDELANEQIAAIKKESEQLKTEIQDYQDECTNKVEVFVSELVARKNDTKSLWKSTRQQMRNSHDLEIIGEFIDLNTKVQDAVVKLCTLKVETLIFPGSFIMSENKCFSQRLIKVPSDMEFRDELTDIRTSVYSVKIAKDKAILCATSHGAQIRDIETMKVSRKLSPNCTDIIQPNEHRIITARAPLSETHCIDVMLADSNSLRDLKTIYRMNGLISTITRIAQFGTDIYIVNTKNKKLIVYSLLFDNGVKGFPLEDADPFAIRILPDSSILIGYLDNKLTKYTLSKEAGLKKVWTLPVPASGIDYDPSTGLLFAVSPTANRVNVISPEGVLLRELSFGKHKKIKTILDIAISGDQIILACRDEGLKRFTIKY